MREKSERQSKSEEVLRELRELERNLWLRELVGYSFFFLDVTKHCNFVNIIRVI